MRTPAMGAGRVAAVVTTLLATLAGTFATAPAAEASFDEVEMYLETYAAGQDVDTGVDCRSSGSATNRTRYPRIGQTDRSSFDDTLTVTDPDDAGDTATYRLRGTAATRAVSSGGEPKSVSFSGSFRVDAAFSKGVDGGCETDGAASAELSTFFFLRRPTLVDVVVRTTGTIGGTYGFDGSGGGSYGVVEGYPGVRRTTVRVGPGPYSITGAFDVGLYSPVTASDPRRAAGTVAMTARFTPAGVATSATTGAGRSLVALPAARRCNARALNARLLGGSARLDQAVFYVNGRRVRTVATPAGGRVIVLRGLPATRPVSVSARLDPKQGRTIAVARRYAACTA